MQKLDRHFRQLTAAAFARYGFAYGELLGRWDDIAGPDLAVVTQPERIRWPRQAQGERRKSGGTLVIRAKTGHGLDVQYQTPAIIERINGFYGYEAIAAIKVIQGRVHEPPEPRARPHLGAAQVRALDDRLGGIGDDRLKAALRRLGEGALAEAGDAGKRR